MNLRVKIMTIFILVLAFFVLAIGELKAADSFTA